MQPQRGWKPLVPPTLHAIILMPIEVVIGIPADEGVGGVIVHRHARPVLQVFHALENGKGGDDREEKEKTDQQLEKQRKPTSSLRMLPKGLLMFLTMARQDHSLKLDGEPRSLVSCILEKVHTRS